MVNRLIRPDYDIATYSYSRLDLNQEYQVRSLVVYPISLREHLEEVEGFEPSCDFSPTVFRTGPISQAPAYLHNRPGGTRTHKILLLRQTRIPVPSPGVILF